MAEHDKVPSPDNFPYPDCDAFGEIKSASVECPGVYYISAIDSGDELSLTREYYVVEAGAEAISEEAKRYGKTVDYTPNLISYDIGDGDSGHYIIEYEINRYRVKRGLPLDEGMTMLGSARYAMKAHPEYFGEIVPPMQTPWGYTTRYKKIMKGVYWIETDEAEDCLAVFYPAWESDISEYTTSIAVFAKGEAKENLDEFTGFLFYKMQDGCLPVFELYERTRTSLESVDYPALMNAIWKNHPKYALAWNAREQQGMNDIDGLFLQELGMDVILHSGVEGTIKLTKGAGTKYLLF